ncbi:MAG: response regulator [Desulfuromonadales bacterium]|nr:response regulator [Desulfuromonadales bacterium]
MTRRILLAEDNQQLARGISDLLTRRGCLVEHHADGISALKAIAAQPPDLLLLDLNLPGLHGFDLLSKLRRSPRTRQLPVVILSGSYRGEKYQQLARQLGVHDYLEKPFKAEALLQAVSRALPEPMAAPAAAPPRPFAQHLRTAFLKNFSGQLRLTAAETTHLLTFANGIPLDLQPGFRHHDFAAFLASGKLLNADEERYFRERAGGRHLFLVQIGCFDSDALAQAELEYLEQELLTAFALLRTGAEWLAVPQLKLKQPTRLNVPQLFHDGYRRHLGSAGDHLIERYRSHYIASGDNFYRYINFLRLDDAECTLLPRLDGRQRLGELLGDGASLAPLFLTLTSLNMLAFTAEPGRAAEPGDLPVRTLFNMVEEEFTVEVEDSLESFAELADTDAEMVEAIAGLAGTEVGSSVSGNDDLAQEVRLMAKSLEGQNHYQVFGIKPAKFSIDLLKERYFAVTRKFGPDILMQLGGEEALLVEKILATVANAYDTLSDVVKKERYDERLGSDQVGLGREGDDRFQAEVQAESGKVFIEMEEWDSAEKALQEAVNFDPDNGDYLASLAWAIYRNPKYAASQAMRTKARQMLNKAVTLDRQPQAFAYKGWLLFEAGQESLAEAEFSKALKLDARHPLARKGLRAIQERREQQKKGLFRRMFS